MAKKKYHEFRDPIHNFIQVTSEEREIIDSLPIQRLRHITQLATTYYIYPGATHKRFEHSLGVMALASRIFDILTDSQNIKFDQVRDLIPDTELSHWRNSLRIAALCHDIGHLPFSHAAEEELLPPNYTHEVLTKDLIHSNFLAPLLMKMHLDPEEISKIAIGPKNFKDTSFDTWIAILSEIITGNFFGADRIDYLLRDSLHTGVAYGKFDHYRLLNTLRILPEEPDSDILTIGIEEGGIQSAEALQLARYFMFSQVYFHEIRRAYDIHLKEFLKNWLNTGQFSTDPEDHLYMTDNDVNKAIFEISKNKLHKAYPHAEILLGRKHFKCIYKVKKEDIKNNPHAGENIFCALKEQYSDDQVKRDKYTSKSTRASFPVLLDNNEIAQSSALSEILLNLPVLLFDYIYVNANIYKKADSWLQKNHKTIIKLPS
ncbi:MAG: HD domain-containing protein [Bacteroidota bacterium]